MTRFLAEIYSDINYPLQLSLATSLTDRTKHIYIFKTVKTEPSNTYWTDWGGGYEGLISFTRLIQIFAETFIQQVFSQVALELIENSFYIDGNLVFLHLPRKPWGYSIFDTEVLTGQGYCTTGPDLNDPSNISYDGLDYPALLDIPSLAEKLPSAINGINLKSTFSFNLKNDDGRFDNTEDRDFFNTPCYIRKSTKENPSYSDFNIVKYGLIEEPSITFNSIRFSVADPYRSLTEPMTQKITLDIYPNAPDKSLGKDIPLGWGSGLTVSLIPIDDTQYLAIDPSYLVSVQACYDSDGNSVSFSVSNGLILSSNEPETAEITGLNKNAGEMIVEEMASKAGLVFVDEIWDTTETTNFINNSPNLSFYYKSGEVRDFVNKVLENDNWFLITKNDSKLTLRSWGEDYDTFSFESWLISKKPAKDFAFSRKYYSSSVEVFYNFNDDTGEYESSHYDDTRESILNKTWKKKKRTSIPTRLNSLSDAKDLAERYLDRFGRYAEDIKIALGEDTSLINKLDKIQLPININGRVMSTFTEWIVKDIDPAQDTLVLEPV